MKKEIIDAIETKLGYEFKDKALLIQAFTRESYAKEQRVKGVDCQSNEQLEYFGDSVLNYLVVCGQLDHFTKVMDGTGLHVLYKEGKLSEFNSHWTDKTMLSDCIDALELAQFLIMSKGDINQKAYENKSVKEDLFESLVGAMWIDSNKNVDAILPIVYKMLNITFESARVEKNWYSQLVEYADKHKYELERECNQISVGFEVKFGIYIPLTGVSREDDTWRGTGIGRNIKEAESRAAEELIKLLDHYGFLNKKMIPNIQIDLEKSVNQLQELNQKGYIGEISYTDEENYLEGKKVWKVTCKISNYINTFFGQGLSKKDAKKYAAYNALVFITCEIDSVKGYVPQNKQYRFLVNMDCVDPELHVLIADSIGPDMLMHGMLFPDNKEFEYFAVNDMFKNEKDEYIRAYEDAKEAIYDYISWYGKYTNMKPGEMPKDADKQLKMFIQEEYDKLDETVKTNGVLLREALLDIANRFELKF